MYFKSRIISEMSVPFYVFFSECTQRAVANFVIIVNMPLSADSRDPKPKPRVPTLDSPIPCPSSSPPNNQSNFKVASVGKAQNVASSTSAPLLFLHRPSTSTGGSHFFGGFFVGTSFLTPAFRYVSRVYRPKTINYSSNNKKGNCQTEWQQHFMSTSCAAAISLSLF